MMALFYRFVISLLFFIFTIQAQVGCLSKSKKLKERFDTKSYHYVSCNCPCKQYQAQGLQSSNRNQCLQCQHYHDAKPFIIFKHIPMARRVSASHRPENPKKSIAQLVANYRKQRGF